MTTAWPTVPIKECCSVVGGATPRRDNAEYWGGSIPWVTPKDISDLDQPYFDSPPEYITQAGYESAATYLVPSGTVLLTSRAPIGNLAIAARQLCTNQGFKSLVPGESVDSSYLYWCMKRLVPKLQAAGNGATFKEVSKAVVEQFEIPLPPKAEQEHVATILNKADTIRRKRQQAIQLADEFLRSVFFEMFGVNAVGQEEWPQMTVGELLEEKPNSIRTGPFGSQLRHSEFVEEGVPVLGIENIVTNEFRWTRARCLPEERFEELKRYQVFPGDLIVTIMGTTGRVAIVPEDLPVCMSTKHLCVMTLNRELVEPVFLWASLLLDQRVRNQAKVAGGGAIMEGWNMGIIKSLELSLPPLPAQQRLREIVAFVNNYKKRLGQSGEMAKDLFGSISQRAFNGEL